MRRRYLSGDGEDHEDVKVAPPAWAQTRLMARSCILSTQQSTSRNRKLQDEIAKKREFLQKPNSHAGAGFIHEYTARTYQSL